MEGTQALDAFVFSLNSPRNSEKNIPNVYATPSVIKLSAKLQNTI